MLDHFHIQNYRLFKDLKIDKLGQVNLIAGKNNTGKTALLEAIRIMVNPMDSTICNIIYLRGDYYPNDKYIFKTLLPKKDFRNNILKLAFSSNHQIETLEFKFDLFKKKYAFYLIAGPSSSIEANTMEVDVVQNPQIFERDSEYIFLSFQYSDDLISELWKKISLTPKEDEIVKIMGIIDSRILKVRVDDKKAKILLQDEEDPIPLKNLGDGANRLFAIALILVNAKNKTLLIDEFEVGLHHSVQKQLWEIIFKYAKEWNIQVFVTTHSQDTVKAFYSVSSKEEYNDMGQYMRLQKSKLNDEIEAVIYSKESLNYAIEDQLETR